MNNCTPTADLIFTFYGAVPNKALINQEHYFKGNGVVATKAEYLAGGAQIWIPSKRTSGIIFDCNDIPDGVFHKKLPFLCGLQIWPEIKIIVMSP